MIALKGISTAAVVLWIISYSFFGFFAVFRVVTLADRAEASSLLWLCGLGLFAWRIGDALGAAIGELLIGSTVWLLSAAALLFFATVGLFFFRYQRLYSLPTSNGNTPAKPIRLSIEKRYSLTHRESETLHILAAGKSTPEIARALCISENTVKFHIKILYKKTGIRSRPEIIAFFEGEGIDNI